MPHNGKKIFEFGDLALSLDEKVLRRNGEIIPLTAKVMEVLCILVSKNGEVVGRDELMESVWPEAFVEESNLTQSIYSLRRSLGTLPNGKQLIETVPKRGYRISAPVTVRSEVEEIAEKASTIQPQARNRRFAVSAAFFALVLLAAAAIFFVVSARRPEPSPVENVKFEKLTFSGDVAFPVISPDGNSFAYVRDNAMFLQDIGSGSGIRLNVPSHAKFGNLQFSPDGAMIYFRDEDSFDAGGGLFQVPRLGGEARPVAQKVWSTVGISPDGSQYAFVRFFPNEGEWTVFLRDAKTGNERKLFISKLPRSIFRSGFPAWSPDGSELAIVEQTGEQAVASRILRVDVATGDARVVETPGLVQIEQVVWQPGGKGLFITGREAGRFFQLWKLQLAGGELKRITNDLSIYRSISLSADGRQMLVRGFSTYAHLWIAPARDLTELKQLTDGNLSRDGSAGLAWTPDGRLVYASRVTGNVDLWSLEPSDGSKRRLTENAGANNENVVVSHDGRYIYFESTRTGKRRIWRMNADGTEPTQISPETDLTDVSPAISPDGNIIYYLQRNPRSNVLWSQDILSGTRRPVTEQGKIVPSGFTALSADGRYIAFRNQREDSETDRFELVIIDLTGAEQPRTVTVKGQASGTEFTDGGQSVDYIENTPEAARLWRQPLNNAKPQLLLELPGEHIFAFTWSADQKTLALSRGRQQNDAILLKGF